MFIAPRGLREVNGRHEPIGDPTVTALLTALSKRIWIQSTLWALILTGLAFVVPF